MGAESEGDMLAELRRVPVDDEPVGSLELLLVMIGRGPDDPDLGAFVRGQVGLGAVWFDKKWRRVALTASKSWLALCAQELSTRGLAASSPRTGQRGPRQIA